MVRPHKLNFMVVRKSMEVRYFLDMIIFLVLLSYIQYDLIKFIKLNNLTKAEWVLLANLKD